MALAAASLAGAVCAPVPAVAATAAHTAPAPTGVVRAAPAGSPVGAPSATPLATPADPTPTPTGVTVAPVVGGVVVSWATVSGSPVTYTVTSSPAGLTCSVVDQSSCALRDTSTVPYAFSVVASSPGSTPSAPSRPTTALAPRLVLVVAGQSNANGYESYAVDPVTRVNFMAAPYTDGADTHDLLTWLPWSELQGAGATPVPLDSPQQVLDGTTPVTVFGPELGLARQLWTDTKRTVTIVKAAYEGTSLAVNWNPARKGTPPDGLYRAAVAKVLAVVTADAAAGQFDVVGGIYWYQGETDATKPAWANAYQAHLAALIAAFRTDLPMSPTAPVVLVKEDITGYIAYKVAVEHLTARWATKFTDGNNAVRAADDWAAANLSDVRTVDSAGLARVAPYDLHLDNVAQLALGQQLAKVSEKLLP